MTIQTLPPFACLIPAQLGQNQQATAAVTTSQTVMTFDGSADRLALITWIHHSGTITEVRFRTGTVSTAGATFRMQIEGVDASGNPDGTAKYTNAVGTVVVGTGDDAVWKTVSINSGTGVAVTKGDLVAFVLTVSSGTPNTVIISGTPSSNVGWVYGDMPYMVKDTGGGTWARLNSGSNTWQLVLNYSGTLICGPGMAVMNSSAATTIGNDAERGMRFVVPWTMRVVGMRVRIHNLAAGGNFRARLYSGTTTVLAESLSSSVDIDGDVVLDPTQDNFYDIFFPESPTLAAGTTYYAAIWQKTANAVPLLEVTVISGYMSAMPGGAQFYSCSRAAGGTGAWTETDTIRPDIALWVDGFDDGAGSGGGMLVHPGMTGRMAA